MDFRFFLKEGLENKTKKIWNYKISASKGVFQLLNSIFSLRSEVQLTQSLKAPQSSLYFTRFSNYFQTSQKKESFNIGTLKKKIWELEIKRKTLSNRAIYPLYLFEKKKARTLIFFKGCILLENVAQIFQRHFVGVLWGDPFIKRLKESQGNHLLKIFKFKKGKKCKFLKFFLKESDFKEKNRKDLKSKLQLGLEFQKSFYKKKKKKKQIQLILHPKDFILGLNQLNYWKKKLKFQGIKKKFSKNNITRLNTSPPQPDIEKPGGLFLYLEKKLKFETKKNQKKMKSFSKNKIFLVLTNNDFEKPKKQNFFFNFHHKKKTDHKNRNRFPKKIKKRKKNKKLKVFSLFGDKKVQITRDKDCFFCFFCFFKNGVFESFTPIDGLVVTHAFCNFPNYGKNELIDNSGEEFFFLFHFLRNLFVLFFSENAESRGIFFLENFYSIIEEFKKLEKKEGSYHSTKKFGQGRDFFTLECLKKKNWYRGIRNFFWEKIDIDPPFLENFSFLSEFLQNKSINNEWFFEQRQKKNNSEKNKNEIFFEDRKPKKGGKNLERNPLFNQKKSVNFLESQIPKYEMFPLLYNSYNGWMKNPFTQTVPFLESSNFKRLNETERKIRDLENFLFIFNVFIFDGHKFFKKNKKIRPKEPSEFYLFSPSLCEKKTEMNFKINSKNLEISSRVGFVFIPGKIPIIFFNNQFSNFKSFFLEKFFLSEPLESINIIWKKLIFSCFLKYKIGTNFFQKKLFDLKSGRQFFKKKVITIEKKVKIIFSSLKNLILKKKSKKNLKRGGSDR